MNVLAVNCGSSSVKLRLIETDGAGITTLAAGSVDAIGPTAVLTVHADGDAVVREPAAIPDWSTAFGALFEFVGATSARIDAIGHRVVQGGAIVHPALIDERVISEIEKARRLAPLHNGPSLEGIRAAQAQAPHCARRCRLRYGVPRRHARRCCALRAAPRGVR